MRAWNLNDSGVWFLATTVLVLRSIVALALLAGPLDAQVLDVRALLAKQAWRDNRDDDWFAARIPAFESPDTAIDATYYYRWELVTRHLTYGSPATGYTFTEFIDRPFWSGAYGAISCPLGHQLEEIRWLRDRRIIDDFTRYWFETPGAQPRSYSNWYATAVWRTYEVLGDTAFLRALLPYMKQQYAGWMAEHWDPQQQMFHWDGLHDGMERNINSRQTDDIDTGADGYRPTLNSYLYGDARAIARASALFGDTAGARAFDARAEALRLRVEEELWDPRREFFLHQFAHDEPASGVAALTRTYDSGRFAGDEHGRELIGYVPWQFGLPEPGKGYERAWRFLMDSAFFLAPYGPTTTERHDPQFHVSSTCCWWSGNSWPYATTQTLVAMANLLNDYHQDIVTARDWMTLFDIYTRTQRRNGVPYVAEAVNPDNGSWDGFDTPGHSEHYFHSGYVNLVITGLAGLRPRADDSVAVDPLAPREWAYFALDGVQYHGHRLSIVWDRDGTRYHLGQGLSVLAEGNIIARADSLGRITGKLDPTVGSVAANASSAAREVNYAVHNDITAYPRVSVSFVPPSHSAARHSYSKPRTPVQMLVDGNYWYDQSPPNRWTTEGSPHPMDTVTVDFGAEHTIHRVALYILDDGAGSPVRAPRRMYVQVWRDGRWRDVEVLERRPEAPSGHRANVVTLAPQPASRVRIVFVPRPGVALGLSELEVWGAP